MQNPFPEFAHLQNTKYQFYSGTVLHRVTVTRMVTGVGGNADESISPVIRLRTVARRVDTTNWGETQKIIDAIHKLPLDGVGSRRDADEVGSQGLEN